MIIFWLQVWWCLSAFRLSHKEAVYTVAIQAYSSSGTNTSLIEIRVGQILISANPGGSGTLGGMHTVSTILVRLSSLALGLYAPIR